MKMTVILLAALVSAAAFAQSPRPPRPVVHAYTCTATARMTHGHPIVFKASDLSLVRAKAKALDICREEAGNVCVLSGCTHN